MIYEDKKKVVVFALYFLALIGCIKGYKIDVYTKIPLGSKITNQLLLNSDQIIENENEILLIYNTSKNPEYHDPHIMFFDSYNNLYAACYFSSEKIDSIKRGIIYGVLNFERDRRKSRYRCDLPSAVLGL